MYQFLKPSASPKMAFTKFSLLLRVPKKTRPAGAVFCVISKTVASLVLQLIISDACLGLKKPVGDFQPNGNAYSIFLPQLLHVLTILVFKFREKPPVNSENIKALLQFGHLIFVINNI